MRRRDWVHRLLQPHRCLDQRCHSRSGSQGDAVRTQFRRTLHSVWARVEPSIGEPRLDDGQPLHQGGYSVRRPSTGRSVSHVALGNSWPQGLSTPERSPYNKGDRIGGTHPSYQVCDHAGHQQRKHGATATPSPTSRSPWLRTLQRTRCDDAPSAIRMPISGRPRGDRVRDDAVEANHRQQQADRTSEPDNPLPSRPTANSTSSPP